MKNVSESAEFVNTTDAEILAWAEEMEKKGLYDHSTSKNLRTALKALVSVLDPQERTDPQHLLDHMESIAERWARANRANPATMKAYKSRAAALLEDFIGFMKNPASFKGRGGPGTPKRPEKKEERRTTAPPVGGATPDAITSNINTFRLPNGKVFRYSLPEDFTIEDLRRVVYHLMPATSDFDPMRPAGFPAVSPALDGAAVQ